MWFKKISSFSCLLWSLSDMVFFFLMLFNTVSLGQRNTLRVSVDSHRGDGQGVTQDWHIAYQLPGAPSYQPPGPDCQVQRAARSLQEVTFFCLIWCSINHSQATPRDCSFPCGLNGLEGKKRDSPAELPTQCSMVLPACMQGQPVLGTCIQAHTPILTPVLRFPLETEGNKNYAKDQGKKPREVDSQEKGKCTSENPWQKGVSEAGSGLVHYCSIVLHSQNKTKQKHQDKIIKISKVMISEH